MAQHDVDTESLVDVDSHHINSVPSDFESQKIKTSTQADRLQHEAADKARETSAAAANHHSHHHHANKQTPLERDAKQTEKDLKAKGKEVEKDAKATANKAEKELGDFASQAEKDAKSTANKTEKKAEELGREAKQKAKEYSQDAKELGHEAKDTADRAGDDLRRNSDNPVYVGNAVVVAALSAALGFGAYRKYASGELTWKVVGLWAGVVGLFAGGDYYVSQWVSSSFPYLDSRGRD